MHFKHSEIFGAVDTMKGLDAVGKIIKLGPAVTTFRIGQHVLTFGRGIGPGESFPLERCRGPYREKAFPVVMKVQVL